MTALQIRSTQILEHQERKTAEDSVKTLHTGEPPWKLKFDNLKYKTTMRGKPVDELTLGSGGELGEKEEEEEEEEKEDLLNLIKASAVNEEDPERDRATPA